MSENELMECDYCTEPMPFFYSFEDDKTDFKKHSTNVMFCCDSCMIQYILKDASLNAMILEAQHP